MLTFLFQVVANAFVAPIVSQLAITIDPVQTVPHKGSNVSLVLRRGEHA